MIHRRTVYYFAFIIVIIILVQLYSEVYLRYLLASPVPGTAMMFRLSEFSLKHLYSMIINILMGVIFALEGFIRNIKIPGKWKLDVRRLVIIGIPLLFLSIEYFNFLILQEVFHKNHFSLITPAREPFFRFLLGYIILSSFYKVKNNNGNIDKNES